MSDEQRAFWWIYSDRDAEWAGLRLAVFGRSLASDPVVEYCMILGDMGDRAGLRHWKNIQEREGWVKVKHVEVPDEADIRRARLAIVPKEGT